MMILGLVAMTLPIICSDIDIVTLQNRSIVHRCYFIRFIMEILIKG